jgi:putative hydrolase of the HAD superfamily
VQAVGPVSVEAVLFDFGGVVVDAPFDAFGVLEQRNGLDPGIVRRINARNPDTNAWAQLERAEIDAARFASLFEAEAASLGATLDGAEIISILTGLRASRSDARPVVLATIADLHRRGVPVGLLSNNIAPMDSTPDTQWVYEEFDAVIESSRVGARKPDEKIYRIGCEILGCSPERTVFLDDLGINLKTARRLGMDTIKVVDAQTAMAELTERLVRDRPDTPSR